MSSSSLPPSTVATLFAARARERPDAPAIRAGGWVCSYRELLERVRRLAGFLAASGVEEGDRVAVLSENRREYLELFLAAGWIGAVAACLNTRLVEGELEHCLDLVEPELLFCSEKHRSKIAGRSEPIHQFGASFDDAVDRAEPVEAAAAIDAESPLLILYTSGTTGLPKGAVLSHRAMIARNMVVRAEYGLRPGDAYVAWSPMYHMGGTEYSLDTLMSGGCVFVVDGFSAAELAEIVAEHEVGWLLLMPGMVGRFADELQDRGVPPRGVRVCGVMADLVPPEDIARITRLLDAPYANTFGATETGNPPASAGLIEVGATPTSLPKTPSVFCEIRLVDADGEDVEQGEPGELLIRGPTLFSGYWNAEDATAEAFEDGWFHMGDVFVRTEDGLLEFVDRVKYLIKSGGENIYPAEIERVLLAHPGVAEAAVVRRPDETWGEVPVAFVARKEGDVSAEQLYAACDESLARYKRPKEIRFIDYDSFPRNASGKVVRHELEQRLEEEG